MSINVDGAAPTSAPRPPIYDPIGASLADDKQDEVERSSMPVSASLSAIEKQFTALVKEFTQTLTSLENKLVQALKQLAAPPARPQDFAKSAPSKRAQSSLYQRYGKIITDVARRHEVDPLLVGAVIRHESGFAPAAVSKAGALGLMQLMPDTAKSLGVRNAFDPRQNVEAGTALLRGLLDRYHGQLDLALAAYNAGTGAVDKYGGIPPFPETQAYVRNVMDTYRESALST